MIEYISKKTVSGEEKPARHASTLPCDLVRWRRSVAGNRRYDGRMRIRVKGRDEAGGRGQVGRVGRRVAARVERLRRWRVEGRAVDMRVRRRVGERRPAGRRNDHRRRTNQPQLGRTIAHRAVLCLLRIAFGLLARRRPASGSAPANHVGSRQFGVTPAAERAKMRLVRLG